MSKLLYITNQVCGPGGLERVLSIKATYLADKLGYDIHILTLNQSNEDLFYTFSTRITFHDITVKGKPLQYLKNYKLGIKNIIHKVNPDIVLVCDDGLKGLFLPLIIGKHTPMIYERHVSKNIEIKIDNPSILDKIVTWFKFKIMDFGASFYDAFVVLTNGNKKEWHTKKLYVIPNPLSFYPSTFSTLTNKKVIAVGKQSFQKGYDRLLKSWKYVVSKHPDWVLEIYGAFDKKQNLEILVRELEIESSVSFFPPTKYISDKYKEASIYTMSSRFEGFGMVLTEAMAYGVPCVSFDCPYGPSDIIKNEEDGYLVTNGNIELFGNRLNTLIENITLRQKMGINARENVKRYLPENILNQWDNLFKKLLNKIN